MANKAGKKEIDPEVLLRKKFRAKCQFRALGRLVMNNAHWLIEGVDNYEGVEDVKRRVAQAVRKTKKKELLNINDKALLNKPADERTDKEKKYLYRIIGGLKCFKRYPSHVKRKLAAMTYFKYYAPGRTIVRQHQEAHALYFIVSGDVVVSQMIFDELIQQYVSVDIGEMHSGDMFGEISLLHNIPRTATVTTTGHCELLALMKEDFKHVLQSSVQKQWDEVRRAMSAFTYFDTLDEVARREGCIVAKMKSYAPNETLLGDGVEIANHVYFILSGRCQMIESLNVIVTTRLGKNFYTLYDPYVPKEESEQDFDAKYFCRYNNLNNTSTELSKILKSQDVTENKTVSRLSKERLSVGNLVQQSIACQTANTSKSNYESQSLQTTSSKAIKSQLLIQGVDLAPQYSGRISVNEKPMPPNTRTYFMQVCRLNPGSSFGFGENMRDRRIVALTPVHCMLLPKIWLLQRNTANIWTRIEHYLDKKIPKKKQLFKEFASARRWQGFREQMVTDVLALSNNANWTTIHDVPYSIRMEELLDI